MEDRHWMIALPAEKRSVLIYKVKDSHQKGTHLQLSSLLIFFFFFCEVNEDTRSDCGFVAFQEDTGDSKQNVSGIERNM